MVLQIFHTDESWQKVAQTKFSAHTDFEKLEGALLTAGFVQMGHIIVRRFT